MAAAGPLTLGDNLNLVRTSVSTSHAVQSASATPGTPDLTSDTGVSSTDNITSRDNGAADRTLQFSVSGTVAGSVHFPSYMS